MHYHLIKDLILRSFYFGFGSYQIVLHKIDIKQYPFLAEIISNIVLIKLLIFDIILEENKIIEIIGMWRSQVAH